MTTDATRIYGFDGDHRFLSNFWWIGDTTTEHLFQASKTEDKTERHFVLSAPTPKEAKERGRTVTLRPDWDTYRIEAMESVLRYKFENVSLRDKLVSTGDAELVEANTWGDRYWGVDRASGQGNNMLGRLLMKLREEYKDAD